MAGMYGNGKCSGRGPEPGAMEARCVSLNGISRRRAGREEEEEEEEEEVGSSDSQTPESTCVRDSESGGREREREEEQSDGAAWSLSLSLQPAAAPAAARVRAKGEQDGEREAGRRCASHLEYRLPRCDTGAATRPKVDGTLAKRTAGPWSDQ
ncbi:hypothetical protein H109_00863 [Trichophyton interdigitale MR816]|uniref:Uncharacterized protein n=1 Tax=Trichophyton interdigitale (strain MR816) TaxID=1215338 RepID=A0A059JIP9_TRIIM|nr:hypothetical protein H109_00863 [Trichophyton interdigitale MR816]